MTDIDEGGYPSDFPYLDNIGDTATWDVWHACTWRWIRVNRVRYRGYMCCGMLYNIPLSGGYGEDNHTLVAEFPDHLLSASRA